METKRERRAPLHFPSVPLTELPDGHSKRREIVSDVLEGLKDLDEYALIKIDLAKLGQRKQTFERRFIEQQRKNTWSCPLLQQKSLRFSSETENAPQALALLGEAPSTTIDLLTGKHHEPSPELGVSLQAP